MTIPTLTLDNDAEDRIVLRIRNFRNVLQSWADVLSDGISKVMTAKLAVSGAHDIYLGYMWDQLKDFKSQFEVLDADFDSLYAGYAASQWHTDVAACITSCDNLTSFIVTNANTYYKSATEGNFMVMEMTTGQKNTFASEIESELGV